MRLLGRVLYLVDDAALMRRQLSGGDLSLAEGTARLRDEISTDEIIPARFCVEVGAGLADHCYQGLRSGTESVVGAGAVAAGGFVASVAGGRRGKGSSREHAPYAELRAGIRLVMARSFERIYRQNCHNLGLVTSTRLDLLPRILAGEDLDLAELCADLDPLSLDIVSAGGLFPYSRHGAADDRGHNRRGSHPPAARTTAATLAEKILAGHADGPLESPGRLQFFSCDLRYSHEYVTPMAEVLVREQAPDESFVDPDRILLFEDHLTALAKAPAVDQTTLAKAGELARLQQRMARDRRLRLHGRIGEWAEGICHAIVAEQYAIPGQLVLGSDSHTCHVGALGCLAIGVGASDIANAWISGRVVLPVPRQVLVRVTGRLPAGVTEKDLMLHLLAMPQIREGATLGAVIEFAGPAVEAMDVDARCTLTNMTAEAGAMGGIVAPDERTVDYLVAHRGVEPDQARAWCAGLRSDPAADYHLQVEIAAGDAQPMVALPGDPGNGVPVASLRDDVTLTRAYGGSCTAAKRADMDQYARVLAGARVHPGVEFFIQVGSQGVLEYCAQRGYLELFERAGATVLGPSCGACINAGPGASRAAEEVTISAQNRNFPGRSGPGALYLASPLTVAASAVQGRICAYQPGGR